MRPGWVRSLEDYWVWFAAELANSGGFLAPPSGPEILRVQLLPDEQHARFRLLLIERQRLEFHDGAWLSFVARVNADLDAEGYSFHFGDPDSPLIWRLDKHPGHPDVGETHIHLPVGRGVRDDRVVPHGEVDVAEVVELIHRYREGWTYPGQS